MKIKIECPSCHKSSVAPESLIGRRVTCPRCKASFEASRTDDGPAETNAGLLPGGGPFAAYPAEFGRYRVLKKLGQGGMGAVYQAIDTQLDRLVALKLPTLADVRPDRAERFLREAKACARLRHPNICTVYDAGTIAGHLFICMEFVEGEPLERRIDPDNPLSEREAAEVVRKVAVAMQEAHDNGIVHRDLKPANILMDKRGEPVVMDFGLAKQVSETDADEAKLTRAGAVLGTLSYMSPEQVKGEQDIGPATDVYSLGVILYELLTGNVPYRGVPTAVVAQILSPDVPRVSATRPHVSPGLDEVCRRAMAKGVGERFTDMKAFAAAMRETQSQVSRGGTNDIVNAPKPFYSLFDKLFATVVSKGRKRTASLACVVLAVALVILAAYAISGKAQDTITAGGWQIKYSNGTEAKATITRDFKTTNTHLSINRHEPGTIEIVGAKCVLKYKTFCEVWIPSSDMTHFRVLHYFPATNYPGGEPHNTGTAIVDTFTASPSDNFGDDPFLPGSTWEGFEHTGRHVMTVQTRNKEIVIARLNVGKSWEWEFKGTVKGRTVTFLAKDMRSIDGVGQSNDNIGTMSRDCIGYMINFTWKSPNGAGGMYSLRKMQVN